MFELNFSELQERNTLSVAQLCVEYRGQSTVSTSFVSEDIPFDHYYLGFPTNERFQYLTINLHKDGASVPSVIDIIGLSTISEGSAVDLAIGACFPKGSTVLVAKPSRTPTTVGGVVQINGRIWVVRFAVFRGAVRSPLFQEELHRSVKFSWPEPDAK